MVRIYRENLFNGATYKWVPINNSYEVSFVIRTKYHSYKVTQTKDITAPPSMLGNNNLVAAFKMKIIWFVDFILNTIRFTCMSKVQKYIEFNKMFKVFRRNFKLYNFELECGF